MGKRRRKLTSPKYAKKYAGLRATIARLKSHEKVESIVESKPVAEKPVPKITKKTSTIVEKASIVESKPVAEKPVPKIAKKTSTTRKTRKRSKRTTIKKDK
tara:strand:- start:543 stop:845 length:303 start_codon:yes stop_codon:yes gene_type:complete